MTDTKFEYDDLECNEHYNKFTNFCEKVLVYNNGIKSQPNPIVVKMNKFNKIWNLMEPAEHREIIESQLYTPIKTQLLQSGDDTAWMCTAGVMCSLPGKGNKDKCVMCSTVYNKCTTLKRDAERDIEGLPDSAAETREELNFPDIFWLYFYRLVRCVISNTAERNKISKKLHNVESDLGIEVDAGVDIRHNPNAGIAGMLGQNGVPTMNNIGNNIGSMIQNIAPALGNIVKTGADGNMQFNSGGLKDVLGKLTESSPALGRQIGENFGSILEQKTMPDMLNAAIAKLQSPATQAQISKMMGGNTSESTALPAITDAEISAHAAGMGLPPLIAADAVVSAGDQE